jgi:hypothetical protein
MDSNNCDEDIWNAMLNCKYVTIDYLKLCDHFKSLAVRIATNRIASISADDLRPSHASIDHYQCILYRDNVLCDLFSIAIHYTDNIHLIISIIDQYVISPIFYSGPPSNVEYIEYQKMIPYVKNDYIRLNGLITCGMDKFDTLLQGLLIFSQRRLPKLIDYLKINPLMINDSNRQELRINIDFDYDKYVVMIDGLMDKISCPKEILNQIEFFAGNVIEENEIVDHRQQPLPLFVHNREIYYGYRSIVYKAIDCLNEIKNCADFNDPLVLEGELPPYLINMYIDSCHTQSIDFKKIHPNDIYQFIRFIDQYPTKFLSIDRLERNIVDYFTSNNISYNDPKMAISLKDICKRYKLKYMYLDIHNKSMEQKNNETKQ